MDVDPRLLDSFALRRRVLLSAAITMVAYLGSAYALTAAGLPSWMLLVVLALLWVLVVRPLMQPVRDSLRLRRDLAYRAHVAQREQRDGAGPA